MIHPAAKNGSRRPPPPPRSWEFDCQITLTDMEYDEAIARGHLMAGDSVRKKQKDNWKARPGETDELEAHLRGQLGERAVAKALNVYWVGAINVGRVPDLAHKIQVRSFPIKHGGVVRVKKFDKDIDRVVGVVVASSKRGETYTIPGWIEAGYGKKECWLRDPNGVGKPVYCVPFWRLAPINLLAQVIHYEALLNIQSTGFCTPEYDEKCPPKP